MTRTKNTINNTIFTLLNYLLKVVLLFVVRTIFIWKLGSEYLGLNSLFNNILTILSLAETGFGSAIVFALYKPTANNDVDKINSLLKLYKKFYYVIAFIVLCLGLILLPFLPYLINGKPNVEINIYVIYIIFLINSVVSYFCAHRRAILYTNQRNDIESKIASIALILVNVFQIISLLLFSNYYIYCIILILGTVLESVLIFLVTKKLYPYIDIKHANKIDKQEKQTIIKNTYSLFLHKVGGVIVNSTDSLIISAVLGLNVLGIYSNYLLIYTSLISIASLIINATKGSIGNLIASKSLEEIEKVQNKLVFLFHMLISFCTICLICLYQPFMKVWLGNNYLLDFSIVVLLAFQFYFYTSRNMVNAFKEAAGLFYNDRFKPLIEGIVNLLVSIILVHYLGLAGVIIGTIVSTLLVCYWVEPYVLYKHLYKKSVFNYLNKTIMYLFVTIISVGITYLAVMFIPDGGIWWLILKFVVCIIVCLTLLILAYLPTKEFKEWVQIFKGMLKNIKHKQTRNNEENTQKINNPTLNILENEDLLKKKIDADIKKDD